jgi:hypothetical protein
MRPDSRLASDPLDLVRALDPAGRSALASKGIEGALDKLGTAITGQPSQPARRRSMGARRRVLVVAATMLAIGAGVAAGAVVFGAHTGLFPTKAEQGVGGPGEALNPAASDFRSVALQVASDIPYPKGYASWREWVLNTQVPTSGVATSAGGPQTPFPAGLVSTGALHGWFAASAFCAWVQNWRQGSVAGDANATAQSAQMIDQAPGWKAVTDEDPHPNPASANDPGAQSGSLFGWMLPYRDAVLTGDRARVEQLLATGYGGGRCWLSDPEWIGQVRAHGADWSSLSPTQLAQKYQQFLADGGS